MGYRMSFFQLLILTYVNLKICFRYVHYNR